MKFIGKLRSNPRIVRRLVCAVVAGAVSLSTGTVVAQDKFIVVASTTSTESSGLFRHLLPKFEKSAGLQVRVVAQGTGQALDTARRGDADVLFVHNRAAEEKFVREGYGLARRDVMYNDFVLVGPAADPAGISAVSQVSAALAAIAASGAPFFSRGDRSGTHSAELRYWKHASIDPQLGSGKWYRETGSGMGATLNIASASNGYALTDRGTWLNFKNRGDLKVLMQGDPTMFNPYGVIVVNPEKHAHVKAKLAQQFADWLVSPVGQAAISNYKISGQQAFFASAPK